AGQVDLAAHLFNALQQRLRDRLPLSLQLILRGQQPPQLLGELAEALAQLLRRPPLPRCPAPGKLGAEARAAHQHGGCRQLAQPAAERSRRADGFRAVGRLAKYLKLGEDLAEAGHLPALRFDRRVVELQRQVERNAELELEAVKRVQELLVLGEEKVAA